MLKIKSVNKYKIQIQIYAHTICGLYTNLHDIIGTYVIVLDMSHTDIYSS